MSGWIKIHRNICKWGWYTDANTFRVFMHLLLNANWEDSRFKGHSVPRGSVVVGRKKLAEDLNLTQQEIRTAIKHLKSTNEITSKVTNQFSIVSIVNYDSYQKEDWQGNQPNNQPANQRATNEQPTSNHIKEVKKERREEGKNIIPPLPPKGNGDKKISKKEKLLADLKLKAAQNNFNDQEIELIIEFFNHRHSFKAYNTTKGIDSLVNNAVKCRQSLAKCIEHSMMKEWQSIYWPKDLPKTEGGLREWKPDI